MQGLHSRRTVRNDGPPLPALEVVVKVRLGPRMTLNGPFELLMLRRIRCSQSQFKLSYSIRRKPS